MGSLTFEDLEEIRAIICRLCELDEEIQAAYNTYRSPSFEIRTKNSSLPSDPVQKAFHHLLDLDKQKADCLAAWISFENKLKLCPVDIQAIIRWRYIIPSPDGSKKTWDEVSQKVYGHKDRRYAHKRFERYMKNVKGGEADDSED